MIGFFSGSKYLAAFASYAATPFYRREQTPPLPSPFSTTQLTDYIRALPDVPILAAMAAYLETLKENYDDLAPEEATAEYRSQQMKWNTHFKHCAPVPLIRRRRQPC